MRRLINMMNYIGHLNYLKGCGIIPNFSELERLYNIDRRTLKKYYDNGGIPKRKKREYHSELDDYIEIIKSKFEEPGNTKKGIYEFLFDKYKIRLFSIKKLVNAYKCHNCIPNMPPQDQLG